MSSNNFPSRSPLSRCYLCGGQYFTGDVCRCQRKVSLCDVPQTIALDGAHTRDTAAVATAPAVAPSAPSLDKIGQGGTSPEAQPHRPTKWTRQQRRLYQRVRSLFTYWESHGYQFLWVCLTTAPGGDASKLAYHHKRIRQQLDRKLDYKGVEFFQVETTEGCGVLHVVWAWKGKRSFYVPQDWLSAEWLRIHGASVVWVSRIGKTQTDRDKVGRYCVSQYCADQRGFVRFSYSWWSCAFPLHTSWERLKTLCSDTYRNDERHRWERHYHVPIAEMIAVWESLLRDGEAMLGETLLAIRGRAVVEVF